MEEEPESREESPPKSRYKSERIEKNMEQKKEKLRRFKAGERPIFEVRSTLNRLELSQPL